MLGLSVAAFGGSSSTASPSSASNNSNTPSTTAPASTPQQKFLADVQANDTTGDWAKVSSSNIVTLGEGTCTALTNGDSPETVWDDGLAGEAKGNPSFSQTEAQADVAVVFTDSITDLCPQFLSKTQAWIQSVPTTTTTPLSPATTTPTVSPPTSASNLGNISAPWFNGLSTVKIDVYTVTSDVELGNVAQVTDDAQGLTTSVQAVQNLGPVPGAPASANADLSTCLTDYETGGQSMVAGVNDNDANGEIEQGNADFANAATAAAAFLTAVGA